MPTIRTEQLILALDVPTPEDARSWVKRLGTRVGCVKIGLQLFTAAGPDLVREFRGQGAEIFLDLKLHDIPNTVSKAVESLLPLDLKFLTIHTSGGRSMMEAALKAASPHPGTTLLGVTVLTSLGDQEIGELGFDHTASGQAAHLARLAVKSGMKGLVCSPLEAPLLRKELGPDVALVTPGVRMPGAASDDQTRIATPQKALRDGASHLVLGRTVMKAESPEAVLDELLATEY